MRWVNSVAAPSPGLQTCTSSSCRRRHLRSIGSEGEGGLSSPLPKRMAQSERLRGGRRRRGNTERNSSFPDGCCSLAKDVGKVVTKTGKLQNKITFPPTSSAARLNRDQKCATPLNYGKQWCRHAGGAL